MPITATDIVFRLSVKTGSAGNTTASTPAGSLGKYASSSTWTTGTNSLFDNVSGDENAASATDYRCVFVHNAHASLTLENAVVYMSDVAGGTTVTIATDNIAPSAVGSASAQAAEIATETTAPTGVGAFSGPTTKAGGLALGSLAAGQVKAVWVKRTAGNTAPANADGFSLFVAGDTAA
jgi:hypothetical protein